MSKDGFCRERLGWWSPVIAQATDYALDKTAWAQCKSNKPKPDGKTAYGIKFSVDGLRVYLAGAVIDKEGIARISLIESKDTAHGVSWLAEWLIARYSKACCVVIDGKNGVDLLIDKICDTWKAKGSIVKPTSKDVISAVSTLTNEVTEQTLTWYELQEELNDSAVTSIKRPIGSGWGFGGDNSAPIEACALALWGVRNSKRNPQKKMKVG